MHDGAIVFKTKIDNSDVQRDLNRVKSDIEKSQKTITESEAAKLPLLKDAEQLKAKLQEARQELALFKDEQAAAQAAMQPGAALPDYMAASTRLPALNAAVSENQKRVDLLEKEWLQVNGKVEQYNVKINKAKAALTAQQTKAAQLSKQLATGGTGMATAMAKAHTAAKKFQTRLGGILKQVLVFGMVMKALNGVVTYLGKALKSNKQFTAELAKLKGALLTAFQPIYELLVPALMALMRIATSVVTAIARVASLLGGKSMSQYAKNAKALYNQAHAIEETGEAAKKAQKSLAGFDEINQLGDNNTESESSTQGTTGADFSAFDTSAIKTEVDELVLFLSGALLLIGMILALSGANIPLGIGLMAVGAIGLASEIAANWESVKQIISEQSELILAISSILLIIGMILALTGAALPLGIGLMVVGAAGIATAAVVDWESVKKLIGEQAGLIAGISGLLLVVGLVLALTGVALPLGIGLIAAGAIGLGSTAAVNWSSIVTALQGPIGKITALVSGALLVIGIILVCTGVGIPLGIALIVAGAAGLVTVTALNWNGIVDVLKGVWQKIVAFWDNYIAPIFTAKFWSDLAKECGNGLIAGFEWAINGLIWLFESLINLVVDGLNLFIGGISTVTGAIGDLVGINLRIPKIPRANLGRVSLPRLAQGAVIPPNREFMAILGDQKHGTNIEAPLSTIQEAVALVMSDYEATNLAGHEATVQALREILAAVLDIEIGDTTIGKSANRYNEKMAIIKGRA